MKNLTPKQIVLVVFSIAGKILGKTKLQKLFFLLQREQEIDVKFPFRVYLYGPFSRELDNQVGSMVIEGSLKCTAGITYSSDTYFEYEISDPGRKEGMKLWEAQPQEIKEKILRHLTKFSSMTPSEIVRYVYENYPDAKPK